MEEGTRINKYLSEIGHCSRREADRLVEQGRVRINGKAPSTGAKVKKRDKVSVDGQIVSPEYEEDVYLAFNKPVGIVCTTDTKAERDNIIEYISYPRRIFPIGRLDKPSEGLIFLTSDGDIVNKILRARNNHEKEYIVTVDKPITDSFIEKMANGIPIMGTMTRKCKVTQKSKFAFEIILTQGLNRQIRRMCEYLGYEVQRLKRTRIMNIALDVGEGQWRELRAEEVSEINRLVEDSSKTVKSKSPSSGKKKKPSEPNRPKKKSHGPKKSFSKGRGTTKGKSAKKKAPKGPAGRRRSR